MAFSAYRMAYASIWDFRFNHIAVVRDMPFTYGRGSSAFDSFHDAIWTRQAGWGTREDGAFGGAPFDASSSSHSTSDIGGIAGDRHGLNGTGRRSGSHQGRPRIGRKPVGGSPRHRGDGLG